jgi:hypothetical protein
MFFGGNFLFWVFSSDFENFVFKILAFEKKQQQKNKDSNQQLLCNKILKLNHFYSSYCVKKTKFSKSLENSGGLGRKCLPGKLIKGPT